jgi:hypothetical protein
MNTPIPDLTYAFDITDVARLYGKRLWQLVPHVQTEALPDARLTVLLTALEAQNPDCLALLERMMGPQALALPREARNHWMLARPMTVDDLPAISTAIALVLGTRLVSGLETTQPLPNGTRIYAVPSLREMLADGGAKTAAWNIMKGFKAQL